MTEARGGIYIYYSKTKRRIAGNFGGDYTATPTVVEQPAPVIVTQPEPVVVNPVVVQ